MNKIDRIIKEYTQFLAITEQDYLDAKNTLPEDEFKQRFCAYENHGRTTYETRVIPTLEEIGHIMAYETANNVRTIKGCVVFFAVLTAVSLALSLISIALR